MGFFDSLFSSSSSNKGGVPSYLRNDYIKHGLNPDDEGMGRSTSNRGKKMYCTMCRRIYEGDIAICPKCENILIEWH